MMQKNPAEELFDTQREHLPRDFRVSDHEWWKVQSSHQEERKRMDQYKVEFYQREDDRWAWRLIARNGNIVATDGGQGYENLRDAFDVLHNLSRGFAQSVVKGFVAAGGTA